MPDPGRALVIVNRGASRAAGDLQAVLRRLEAAGWSAKLHEPVDPRDVSTLVRREGPAVDAVILGGGDGTLGGALAALLEVRRPLGVLPLGTANDFARALGLPSDPVEAAEVVLAGHVRRVDVGEVNGTPFLNSASLGLSVGVTRRLQDGRKKRLGTLAYPLTVLEVVRLRRVYGVRLRWPEGECSLRVLQLAVSKGPFQGGGAPVRPEGRIDDGFLDVVAIEPRRLWRLALVAGALRIGRHAGLDGVEIVRTRELEIRTPRPVRLDLDGELRARTPARLRVRPRALAVYAPREGGPQDRPGADSGG